MAEFGLRDFGERDVNGSRFIKAWKIKRLRRKAVVIIMPAGGREDEASRDPTVGTNLTKLIQRSGNQERFDADRLEIDG